MLNIGLVLVVFVLVMGCPNHNEAIWCESALSFFAASRHVLVTSVRNILLVSTEADINSVTYLGTACERAGLGTDVVTSKLPGAVFDCCGIGSCPFTMKVLALGDGLDAIVWYGCS